MAKVTRKPTGVRRSAAARSRNQKARAAKRHTSGMLDKVMAALPFTEEQWNKFFLFLIVAAGLGIAWPAFPNSRAPSWRNPQAVQVTRYAQCASPASTG